MSMSHTEAIFHDSDSDVHCKSPGLFVGLTGLSTGLTVNNFVASSLLFMRSAVIEVRIR